MVIYLAITLLLTNSHPRHSNGYTSNNENTEGIGYNHHISYFKGVSRGSSIISQYVVWDYFRLAVKNRFDSEKINYNYTLKVYDPVEGCIYFNEIQSHLDYTEVNANNMLVISNKTIINKIMNNYINYKYCKKNTNSMFTILMLLVFIFIIICCCANYENIYSRRMM